MSWYKEYKTSSIKNDIDINYREVNKKYVKTMIDEISTILKQKNLEKTMEEVKDNTSKSKDKVFKHNVGKIDGLKVFLVNGNEIKVKFFMGFVEGGNGMVYGTKEDKEHPNFIPKDELWVDADVDISSFPYILIHEAVEYYLMKNEEMKYEDAHDRANGVEKRLREKNFFK